MPVVQGVCTHEFVTVAIGILLRSRLILVIVRPLSIASSARVERVSKEPRATVPLPPTVLQRLRTPGLHTTSHDRWDASLLKVGASQDAMCGPERP